MTQDTTQEVAPTYDGIELRVRVVNDIKIVVEISGRCKPEVFPTSQLFESSECYIIDNINEPQMLRKVTEVSQQFNWITANQKNISGTQYIRVRIWAHTSFRTKEDQLYQRPLAEIDNTRNFRQAGPLVITKIYLIGGDVLP